MIFPDGVAFAEIFVVFPTFTVAEVFVSFRDGFLTVILQVTLYSPQDAVITAVPFALAVTTPLLFTAATFVLLDFHVILSVRFVVTLRVVFVLPFV